jgi:hypothetical protein
VVAEAVTVEVAAVAVAVVAVVAAGKRASTPVADLARVQAAALAARESIGRLAFRTTENRRPLSFDRDYPPSTSGMRRPSLWLWIAATTMADARYASSMPDVFRTRLVTAR